MLKFVKSSSGELRILEHLVTIKSESNHTTPFLEKIPISRGYILALPYLQPLQEYTAENSNNVISLANQFLEGISFLHHHLIAHLDLKPDNVLVNAHDRPLRTSSAPGTL